MNAATEQPPAGIDYAQDFYAWTQRQAQLARAGRLGELDLDHLAEEIESMGRSQLRAVTSLIAQVVIHLLCLQFSPAIGLRRHWRIEVRQFRRDIALHLADSSSLRPRLDDALASQWSHARAIALEKLTGDSVRDLPAQCPYAVAQVLDEDWFPANEHGAA